MDQRFLPAFETQARQLISNTPFKEIRTVIASIEREVLSPTNHSLRADGLVFLLINIAYMIVFPWEYTEINDFLATNKQSLEDDLRMVMNAAKGSAPVPVPVPEREISANTLLDAVATSKNGMKILNLRIWGPH